MEGIIGRFWTSLGISIIGEHPCLFHAHVIKATFVLYHLIPADLDESQ